MPVLKYRLFCVVSFANVKNIGFLNVYQAVISNFDALGIAFANVAENNILLIGFENPIECNLVVKLER